MNKKTLSISLLSFVLLLGAGCTRPAATPPVQETPPNVQNTTNSQMLVDSDGLAVRGEDVTYGNGRKGFYAEPEAAGDHPGVVMIHEWWGLNDHIKDMARQLAADGYRVVAVDLYNGQVATTQEQAQQYRSAMKQDEALKNMQEAAAYLRSKGADKLASLGWCFGGGQSLQLALSGEKMDATVIYYGNLVTTTDKMAKMSAPVLGIFGDKDTSIPVEQVNQFDTALDSLGIQNSFHIYEGVGHAFANPSGQNYAPEETQDAWQHTREFLAEHLK